jgi:RecA/RadA recombinase
VTKKKVKKKDPPVSDRAGVLAGLTKSVKEFKLWADVVAPMVLRLGITSVNRAMKIGGVSAGMLGVVHGPSQGGKTLFVSEVLRAVAETGGLGMFCDAECRGVDLKWFEAICGELAEILYYKPRTFEEFVARVQEFRTAFRKAKDAGALPAGAMLGIGVDSLNRLTPKDELKILLEGKGKGKGGDHVEARKYPLRAMFIGSWLDTLIPTLEPDEAIVVVLREGENLDAMPGQKKYKVKGGKAPGYDAGWICRITARGKVKVRARAEKAPDIIIGEKHEVEVTKNSMGPKDGEIAFFYSSVGAEDGAPLGLDRAREVREEAIERGYAKHKQLKGGTGFYIDGDLVAADKPKFLAWLLEPDEGTGQIRHELVANLLDGEFDGER